MNTTEVQKRHREHLDPEGGCNVLATSDSGTGQTNAQIFVMPMLQQTQLFGPTESTEQLGQACGKRAIARDAPKKIDDKNK